MSNFAAEELGQLPWAANNKLLCHVFQCLKVAIRHRQASLLEKVTNCSWIFRQGVQPCQQLLTERNRPIRRRACSCKESLTTVALTTLMMCLHIVSPRMAQAYMQGLHVETMLALNMYSPNAVYACKTYTLQKMGVIDACCLAITFSALSLTLMHADRALKCKQQSHQQVRESRWAQKQPCCTTSFTCCTMNKGYTDSCQHT